MSEFTIYLGDKNYSSWSLRPWLALALTGAAFDEVIIELDRPDTAERIGAHSPSGRVPALKHGELVIWDSLSICEYLAERFPDARLWPADVGARALARSVSCEMHSGFAALRAALPFNLTRTPTPVEHSPAVAADVARVVDIWSRCLAEKRAPGPYLFGHFSIADAMYAPVVTRFHSYAVPLPTVAADYCAAMRAHPAMLRWAAGALAEPRRITRYELAGAK